jgi:osmotically-inducible protein OsmY
MFKARTAKWVVFALAGSLVSASFALSACSTAPTQTETETQITTSNPTQTTTTTQQNTEYVNRVSDEQILEGVHRVIRILGLDTYPDLTFTAEVENGVVTLDGTVLYYDEENMLNSVGSIDGIVRIISNYELLAE